MAALQTYDEWVEFILNRKMCPFSLRTYLNTHLKTIIDDLEIDTVGLKMDDNPISYNDLYSLLKRLPESQREIEIIKHHESVIDCKNLVTPMWVNFLELLNKRFIPKWGDCKLVDGNIGLNIVISYAWSHKGIPDMTGTMLESIINQFIEALMYNLSIWDDYCLVKYDVRGKEDLLGKLDNLIKGNEYKAFDNHLDTYLSQFPIKISLEHMCLISFYLSKINLWIDSVCIPQDRSVEFLMTVKSKSRVVPRADSVVFKKRNAIENSYFKLMLSQIDQLIQNNTTVIIWRDEAPYKGWPIVEAIIGRKAGHLSIIPYLDQESGHFMRFKILNADGKMIREEQTELKRRGYRTSSSLNVVKCVEHIDKLINLIKDHGVNEFLVGFNLQVTNGADISLLAKSLSKLNWQ